MQSSRETVVRSSGKDRVLVIMAKAPKRGAVKTRLTPRLSPEAVIDFYLCLLYDTLALARSLTDVEVAIMCPESDVSELARLAGNDAIVVAQKGEGLAAGLTSVFAHFAGDRPRPEARGSGAAGRAEGPDVPHRPSAAPAGEHVSRG